MSKPIIHVGDCSCYMAACNICDCGALRRAVRTGNLAEDEGLCRLWAAHLNDLDTIAVITTCKNKSRSTHMTDARSDTHIVHYGNQHDSCITVAWRPMIAFSAAYLRKGDKFNPERGAEIAVGRLERGSKVGFLTPAPDNEQMAETLVIPAALLRYSASPNTKEYRQLLNQIRTAVVNGIPVKW